MARSDEPRICARGLHLPGPYSDYRDQQGFPSNHAQFRSFGLGDLNSEREENMAKWNRRRILKGILHGSAVSVALPFLDCFLDGNGEALASGAPIPTRFGTWFWGCGINQA